jgi:hypothetical protein
MGIIPTLPQRSASPSIAILTSSCCQDVVMVDVEFPIEFGHRRIRRLTMMRKGRTHSYRLFFPPLPNILDEPGEERQQPDPLPMGASSPHEVEAVLMKMAPWRAPGPDRLPAICGNKSGQP